MTPVDRRQTAERLMTWASSAQSGSARSVVSELSDIHAAAQKAVELIESLASGKPVEKQAEVVAQLEVWLFDELGDRLATLKPKLETVSKELSEASHG